MARISFTDNLRKHMPAPPQAADGPTVSAVLDAVFADNPRLRSYILDDQSRLRKHVNIYINNELVRDRTSLSDAVAAGDEVFVFQALSGG